MIPVKGIYFNILLIGQIFYLLWTTHAYREIESVIIDTDAGSDDAMAILMLLSSHKNISVEAITCVRGNTGVNNVSINVLKTLMVANRLDIPVYVGSDNGLVYTSEPDNYFGDDGFGDFEFPSYVNTSLLRQEHAAVAIAEMVDKNPGRITIMCIGPLTNIALASQINKFFYKQVKRILIIGGSYKGQGNMGPGLEFNIYCDAEAAASFFNRLLPSTQVLLLPYETNLENSCSLGWRIETLGKLGTAKIDFLNLAERKTFKKIREWTPFDQNLAAILLHPEIIMEYHDALVTVNTTYNSGATEVIFGKGSVQVVTKINRMDLKRILIASFVSS